MYDVTTVFCTIGCCQKTSFDHIRWVGFSHIPATLIQLQRDAHADCPNVSLDAIMGVDTTVGISILTARFMLCFLVLRTKSIDIQAVSRYIARWTGRFKSTLCKLYQIAHILEAVAIVTRSEIASKITLAERFFVPIEIKREGQGAADNPYSIQSLLHHTDLFEDGIVEARRTHFVVESAKRFGQGPRQTIDRGKKRKKK
jgi:hypothetical protein